MIGVPNILKISDINEVYYDPNMSINAEWKFLNNSKSNEFMALESTVNLILIRNKEHLIYLQKRYSRDHEVIPSFYFLYI